MVALFAAAGVALLRVLAFDVGAVHRRDALALHDFMSLDRPLLTSWRTRSRTRPARSSSA